VIELKRNNTCGWNPSLPLFLNVNELRRTEYNIIMNFFFYRNSNFLKPGEMKPPYSSMSRSTSSSMRSSHSSHHRPTHKPNLAIPNVKNVNRFSQSYALAKIVVGWGGTKLTLTAVCSTSPLIFHTKLEYLHENIFISTSKSKSSAPPPQKKKSLKLFTPSTYVPSYIRRGSFMFLFINILISLISAES